MGAFAGVLQKMATSALLKAVTAMINHPMDVINNCTKPPIGFGYPKMRMKYIYLSRESSCCDNPHK